MAGTLDNVSIYDPAYPFNLISAQEPGIDTWYALTVITRVLRERMPKIPDSGEVMLGVSSGMYVKVPFIIIGIQVGNIRINNIQAAVVEEGAHDLIMGTEALQQAFNVGKKSSEEAPAATFSSEIKDDPEALSIELYSTQSPIILNTFEKFLQYERWLYNIHLVSTRVIRLETTNQIDKLLSDDAGIPDDLKLKLTWIDSGSIWLTLKSGSQSALKYVASLFETGTTAKLAQQVAESNKAESEAKIQEATRASTVEKIKAEQNRLRTENIGQTYEAWRNEMRNSLKFMDELIEQLDDPEVIAILKEKKKQAILELAEQQMLPIVRNVPQPHQPSKSLFLLPPIPSPNEKDPDEKNL